MLFFKDHLRFWALSWAAVLVYQVLIIELDLPHEMMLSILALTSIHAVAGLRRGPNEPSSQFVQLVRTGWLVVSLGAATRYIDVPEVDVDHIGWALHVLMAFTTLGIVEPVRQNRRELQPCYLSSGVRVRRNSPIYTWATFARLLWEATFTRLFLFGLTTLIEWSLDVPCLTVWQNILLTDRRNWGSMLVLLLLLVTPLIDMAETVFYFLHRRFYPHWIPEPAYLVWPDDWRRVSFTTYDVVLSLCFWLSIFLPLSYFKNGALKDADVGKHGSWSSYLLMWTFGVDSYTSPVKA